MRSLNRRQFVHGSLAAGAALSVACRSAFAAANEEINIGIIGMGGRGHEHARWFDGVPGVNIAAVCDPDEERLNKAKSKYPKAAGYSDLRKLLDDKSIDAVTIAACNHWHCLAAVWAVQAGKDVYVEKPLGHNQYEQQQLVAAARKYNKIVQVGTQQRSDPLQANLKKYLHEEKALGEVKYVRANRYGTRGAIGLRKDPLAIPSNVDYSLWLGPAQDEPIYRNKLQYDWHWDFNTGSGEMGNWGVHILDDVRNVALLDQCTLPKRILAGGGRIAYNDAGNTPNIHFIYFDTGVVPVVFDLSNLNRGPDQKGAPTYKGVGSGYVVHCEGGYYAGGRGGGAAYDNNGKQIKKFGGNSGGGHAANFIDAVRQQDRSILNCEVEVGHHSSGWCNLGNVAYRVGGGYSRGEAMEINSGNKAWEGLLEDAEKHITAWGVKLDSDEVKLSPVLEFDPQKEVFHGDHSEAANKLLTREFRKGYEMPAQV